MTSQLRRMTGCSLIGRCPPPPSRLIGRHAQHTPVTADGAGTGRDGRWRRHVDSRGSLAHGAARSVSRSAGWLAGPPPGLPGWWAGDGSWPAGRVKSTSLGQLVKSYSAHDLPSASQEGAVLNRILVSGSLECDLAGLVECPGHMLLAVTHFPFSCGRRIEVVSSLLLMFCAT